MATLVHMDRADTDPLRAFLQEFLDTGRKAQRTFWLGRAFEFLLMLLVIGVILVIGIGLAALLHAPDGFTGCNPFEGFSGWNTQPFTDPTANKRRANLQEAAKAGRTDLIGLCVLYLGDINPAVRAAADHALLVLLPKIRLADWEQFTPAEREALVKALDRTWPVRTAALLQALEQVGDASVLQRVEALTSELKNAEGKTARELAVAAEECLQSLRQRAEQSRQAQTLLRASQPWEGGQVETLLRPAQSAGATHAEELLRAVHQ